MRRPWLPLRPRRDDSCAVGARRGARSRRRIERLLSPPIAPRLEVLKRGAARRAKCGVVRHDRRMTHSALLGVLLLFNTTFRGWPRSCVFYYSISLSQVRMIRICGPSQSVEYLYVPCARASPSRYR